MEKNSHPHIRTNLINFLELTKHFFTFRNVSENEILKIISKLKTKCSSGVDEISTRFLKQYSSILTKPLTKIINQSLSTGIFPDKLKIAKVIPIHKDNDLDQNILNNYRPISILPCISKIFERVVYDQLFFLFFST